MLASARIQERLARRTIALVLAGGRGSRLKQLTDRRAKPAVFFGGKFRIIDFALSNCLNSDIRRIAVLTPIQGAQPVAPFADGLVVSAPGDERVPRSAAGAAAARRGDLVSRHGRCGVPEFRYPAGGAAGVLHRSGRRPHLQDGLLQHAGGHMRARAPTASSPASRCRSQQASEFGVMAVDEVDAHRRFPRKADDRRRRSPASRTARWRAWAIYVFTADFLYDELQRDHGIPASSHDFGKDMIPHLVSRGLAVAHRFEDSCVTTTPEAEPYWRDVGTIDAYWAANLDLVDADAAARHLRSELADLDLSAAIAAGEVRLRRRRPPRHGGRFDGVGRLHHLRRAGRALAVVFESAGSIRYAQTCEAVLLPEVEVGRHAGSTRSSSTAAAASRRGWWSARIPKLDAKRFYRSDGGVVLVSADMLAAL